MIGDITKAVDYFIDLAKERRQSRADLLEKFVEPAFASFEAIHQAYLDAFARYRRDLQQRRPVPDVLADIRREVILSSHKRDVLRALVQPNARDDVTAGFRRGIYLYLTGVSEPSTRLRGVAFIEAQRILSQAATDLVDLVEASDGEPAATERLGRYPGLLRFLPRDQFRAATDLVDAHVVNLQRWHERISKEYADAKRKLLT